MIVVDLYKKQRKDQNIWRQETNNKYKLHKAYFQHYIALGDFKNLTRRLTSDKILRDQAFNTAISLKNYGYQRSLASMAYNLFDKKTLRVQINLPVVVLKMKISQTKN